MQIKLDKSDMAAVDTMLINLKGAYPRVIYRSVNKTLGNVQTKAVDEIYSVLNLTKTRIKKDFKQYKAGPSNLKGSIVATGKPINLASFSGTTQTTKGIGVRIFRGGTRHTLKHAFIWERSTKSGSTAKTAFWRAEVMGRPYVKTRPYAYLAKTGVIKRLPIETLTGPRIEDIYARPTVIDNVLIFGGNRYAENVQYYLDYEFSKL